LDKSQSIPTPPPTDLYSIALTSITGEAADLSLYRGKVLLIVNVASKCGYTKQYEGLQKLYETYADSGLVVLGFPANNFANQEPGSDDEIYEFCTTNFSVTFPMYSKISVAGDDIHPLYRFLTQSQVDSTYKGSIAWNFTKFIINREGRTVARFAPAVSPTSAEVVQAIRDALAEPNAS
jgi:glutathione peroxidase